MGNLSLLSQLSTSAGYLLYKFSEDTGSLLFRLKSQLKSIIHIIKYFILISLTVRPV